CLRRGDRVPYGLHQRGTAGAPGAALGEQRLWSLPSRPDRGQSVRIMKISATDLPGVLVIEPVVHGDARGFFQETYHARRYAEAGIALPFVQDNHSRSGQGILRGLHYQLTHPQGKLVRVTQGAAFDVAVDIRKGSPNFGKWVG